MGILGNIIWFMFGGAVTGLLWCFAGIIWSITLIGIPIGKQCFKIAKLCFFPFGKTVENTGGTGSFLLNMLWICFTGWTLAVEAVVIGLIYCLTIVGIPFGKQYFKIAKLALMPFGSEVYTY
jgi:uncharacterized membrane protein YccF (DUF307 family)